MFVDSDLLLADLLLRIADSRDMPIGSIGPGTALWEDLGFTYSEMMCMLCDILPEYGLPEDVALQLDVDDIYDISSVACAIEALVNSQGYGCVSALQAACA